MKKAATLIATLMGALAFAGQVYAQVTMGHVHLNVADVDAQIKFWTTQFDAKPVEGGVEVPGMRILLNHQAPAYGSEGTALDHFGFKVHSRDEMASRARAAG